MSEELRECHTFEDSMIGGSPIALVGIRQSDNSFVVQLLHRLYLAPHSFHFTWIQHSALLEDLDCVDLLGVGQQSSFQILGVLADDDFSFRISCK